MTAAPRNACASSALSPAHYVDVVVVTPGTWHFSFAMRLDHRPVAFEVSQSCVLIAAGRRPYRYDGRLPG